MQNYDKMNFITSITDTSNFRVGGHLPYYLWIVLLSLGTGIIIAFGFLTHFQILLLVGAFVLFYFGFKRPDIICLITIILMFIPLSLGTVFKARITWVAEPLILLLFVIILLRNLNSKEKSPVLSSRKNPFLIPILIYGFVLIISYMRYPLPASSIAGFAEEMGGIRYYYEKIILFVFCISLSFLIERFDKFSEKLFNVLLLMAVVITSVGFLISISSVCNDFIRNTIASEIFTDTAILTGMWYKTVDMLTDAMRNAVLWIAAFGILILLSDLVRVRRTVKIVLFIFFFAGLVFSATRSFFFGTLCALIVWAFLSGNKKLLFLILLITIIGFLLPGMGLVSRQFDRILYFPADLDKLTSFRYELFKVYWTMFLENPIFGVGVGATGVSQLPAASPEYFLQQNLRFGGHGFFLGTLYTQGVIGLLPFLLICFLTVRIALKLYRLSDQLYRAIGLFSVLFISYSIIPFLIGGDVTYNQLFVVVGILAGAYAKSKKENDSEK